MVVSEGDSISVTWGGNYTGMYAKSRDDIEFHGMAKGGSGLSGLEKRLPDVLAFKPDLVSILIGANDLAEYETADAYAERLKAYVDEVKASGASVVVGTVLPKQTALVDRSAKHNRLRAALSDILKEADWVDGIFDVGAEEEMGPDFAPNDRTLYTDGIHPTDGTHGVGEGGQRKLFRVYQPVMDEFAKDVR